jgi:hypothetical protein
VLDGEGLGHGRFRAVVLVGFAAQDDLQARLPCWPGVLFVLTG